MARTKKIHFHKGCEKSKNKGALKTRDESKVTCKRCLVILEKKNIKAKKVSDAFSDGIFEKKEVKKDNRATELKEFLDKEIEKNGEHILELIEIRVQREERKERIARIVFSIALLIIAILMFLGIFFG